MDLSIANYSATYTDSASKTSPTSKSSKSTSDTKAADVINDKNDAVSKGVVYEKNASKAQKSYDYSATIKQLKADQINRSQQMVDLVNKTLSGQGKASFTSNIKSLFDKSVNGNLADLFRNMEVDEDTIEQAKKDISEDGYWGVTQTSDRLVSMAQALAGGDKSKADELIGAIKKGFKQATHAWGENLPDICQKTLSTTIEKMEKWRDSTE